MNAELTPVCPDCKHLMFEGKDAHVCPDAEYYSKRDALFEDAMRAEELFLLDELEGEPDSYRYI